jgi:hypothetical protein
MIRLESPQGHIVPNARLHLLSEAAATQERRLEAVRCKPLFGKGSGTDAGRALYGGPGAAKETDPGPAHASYA